MHICIYEIECSILFGIAGDAFYIIFSGIVEILKKNIHDNSITFENQSVVRLYSGQVCFNLHTYVLYVYMYVCIYV